MKLVSLLFFISLTVLGQTKDVERLPKSFTVSHGKAVFVDFISADYEINYDLTEKKSSVVATIKFNQVEPGFPVFDSFETPKYVELDGKEVSSIEVKTPDSETTVRYINKITQLGTHVAKISVPLTKLVQFTSMGFRSAFWTTDLEDRGFLERYMPANLEYDQVKMTFIMSFKGNTVNQKIYTNGEVKKIVRSGYESYQITYPAYFNSSSIFFHTVPEGSTNELKFSLKSIDGREVPVIVYASGIQLMGLSNLQVLKNKTTEYFQELERDYGAWPHPSLIVYNAGAGGMEYCGATMTSLSALGHEMFHSYFARGVMPANGNSGWIDEALASWRDEGYQSSTSLMGSSRMSAHPKYTRKTDISAYSFGERFMGYLDGKLRSYGGLKPFMRHMLEKRIYSPFLIESFIQEMNDFYGISLDSDFRKFTFGEKGMEKIKSNFSRNIHRKMTLEEMEKFL